MRSPFLLYKICQDGAGWRWEIIENGRVIAYGYEKTSIAARVQAMLFVLNSGTAASDR